MLRRNSGKEQQKIKKEHTWMYRDIPPVRAYPSRKAWEEACWRKIAGTNNFIARFATAHERHVWVIRAAIVDRLHTGRSYKQISEELWISPQTVSEIKKAMQNKNEYGSYWIKNKRKHGELKRGSVPFTESPGYEKAYERYMNSASILRKPPRSSRYYRRK